MKSTIQHLYIWTMTAILASSCVAYHLEKGNEAYDYFQYTKALHHFELANKHRITPSITGKIAESYFKVGRFQEAKTIYMILVSDPSEAPTYRLPYARVLMELGDYSMAHAQLNAHLIEHPEDRTAQMALAGIHELKNRYIDTTLYALNPIRQPAFINAFSSTPYGDGIVFSADKEPKTRRKTSNWTGNSYLDLYYIEPDQNGAWTEPTPLSGKINGRLHDGTATFSADGKTIFFTRNNYVKRKMEVNELEENNLKIFSAELIDGKWNNLEEFPFNSDYFSCGHPTLSSDGKTLIFVSDMPGGYGGTDLYFTQFINGKWAQPENLGAKINTNGNEQFPYLRGEDTLYFSSNGHNSMGGLDVFVAENTGSSWSTPENLNYPVNSSKDDFGFALDESGNTGYLSSARFSTDKIYSFRKFDPTFNLFGFAHKKGERTPVENVRVEIMSKSGKKIQLISKEDGTFHMLLQKNENYQLHCTKVGCFGQTSELNTTGLKYSQNFYVDYEVEEIVINKPIVLENIYYDFDKWFIRPDAAIELDKLVKLLIDNPEIDIEMGSHTDVRGTDEYNQVLSEHRAQSAVEYLISKGIDKTRLTYKGYGEMKLVNSCKNGIHCTEDEHQQNRRTEFKVTAIRP
jgi:outer membrane protein OmpA-like peptidoglycan-associated protein/tetratricopeptide (TPR) repeat protein